jgi:hypothetical protein
MVERQRVGQPAEREEKRRSKGHQGMRDRGTKEKARQDAEP